MYLFGTVSTKNPPVIVVATASRFRSRESTSRPPQPGKPAQISAGIRFRQKSRLLWPPGPRTEKSLPDAHQRKEGPFPPQETTFYVNPAETFEPRNDLAAKRPDL
jgi:hypothetical protein